MSFFSSRFGLIIVKHFDDDGDGGVYDVPLQMVDTSGDRLEELG